MESLHPKKSWTQKRTRTTIILLKIRVNHGILILIEVHPLEKICLIPRRMELRNQETKAIASKGKGKVIFENVHPKKKLDTIEDAHNNHTIAD